MDDEKIISEEAQKLIDTMKVDIEELKKKNQILEDEKMELKDTIVNLSKKEEEKPKTFQDYAKKLMEDIR